MAIRLINLDSNWLTELGEAHVVVAQVAPPTADTMRHDATRPSVMATMRGLLGPDRRLNDIVTGNRPAILVLPELAFGFCDWGPVDELIRAWDRPLIVVAGFGFTSGQAILSWLEHNEPTQRIAGWEEQNAPSPLRYYNGGWSWVHRPGSTTCVTFLKLTAEQRKEVHIEGLDQGRYSLALRLNDLIIFPAICADLLSDPEGKWLVAAKISTWLEHHANDATRVLIIGLLLQEVASGKWRNAIIEVARGINDQRVNVCLANGAQDILAMQEDIDRWRAYSGIYISSGRNPLLDQFTSVRRFSTEQIESAVVRATSAMVLGGPIRWTFQGATGKHIWNAPLAFGIDEHGTLIEHPCGDRFKFELLRIIHRLSHAHDAPEVLKTNMGLGALEQVAAQIKSTLPPDAKTISGTILYGQNELAEKTDHNADQLSNWLRELTSGLRAVGALRTLAEVSWQRDANCYGQLQLTTDKIDLLVWSYPGSAIEMKQILRQWHARADSRRPVILFKKAFGLGFAAPDKASSRRDDIADPPISSWRDATEPTPALRIVECSLEDIESCFEFDNPDAFADALRAQLKTAQTGFSKSEVPHAKA